MKLHKTERGFEVLRFIDKYGSKCSLQKSSLATENAIWFGVDDANPQIMANDAKRLGIPTDANSGWIKFEIPKEVLLSTRMHLTQDTIKQLLPTLQKFAETGELYTKYKLTFWQKFRLIPLRLMWLTTEPDKRKTWHEVKKGMEAHEHKFTKPFTERGYRFLQCEHEGCNICEPVD